MIIMYLELIQLIEQRIEDNRVTLDEFVEYYNFVSATIESDQMFELMMNNAWRMNEQRSSNRRPDSKGIPQDSKGGFISSERPLSSGQRTPPPIKSGARTPREQQQEVLNIPTPNKGISQQQQQPQQSLPTEK